MSKRSFNGYFDNAATSFPKPDTVALRMSRYLVDLGGPYGRSAYRRAFEVSRVVEETRESLAAHLGVADSRHVVFTPNATHALNTVLQGLGLAGAHVLISPLEHNAVMRPLLALAREQGLSYEVLPHFADGLVDVSRIGKVLRDTTRLVVINHQSNVNGVIQPVDRIKAAVGSCPVLVDASQSGGHLPLRPANWSLDYCALTGHKGLLGPTGVGALYMREPHRLRPLIRGGTGSRSESFDMPEHAPDTFEAGTPNIVGAFGLLGALEGRPEPAHGQKDLARLLHEVEQIDEYTVHAATAFDHQGPVFSITHGRLSVSELSHRLSRDHGIETRSGLHCAPLAHQSLGTFPAGTVRLAPSVYHTGEDFEQLLRALQTIDETP